MSPAAVAALIIGNEVLTAKISDANGAWLIKRLRELALPLATLTMVPDDVDAIVEALQLARRRARWVITSGGVGPTHDDVTVRAVSLALGRRVVRRPEIEALVKQHYQERATLEAMRLAWKDRLELFGDPERAKVPISEILSAQHAQELASRAKAAASAPRSSRCCAPSRSNGGCPSARSSSAI